MRQINTRIMHKKRDLNNFLEEYPLYKKFEAVSNYIRTCDGYTDPFIIHGETFNYLCPIENKNRIFEINVIDGFAEYWGKLPDDGISDKLIDSSGKLNYVHHFEGKCTGCKNYKMDFLLHIWSDEIIPKETNKLIFQDPKDDSLIQRPVNIFIEKIGEYPQKSFQVAKYLSKFFDRESNGWYYKAKKSLNERLGIGAFSYYRRIVEKELVNIVTDISKLNDSNSIKITKLLAEYKQTNKIHLLYDNIFEFLPLSLKSLGDNPLKLLYKQTSDGLHNLTEEECLRKSESIDFVLTFVIKKLYEERNEAEKIKSMINELRK